MHLHARLACSLAVLLASCSSSSSGGGTANGPNPPLGTGTAVSVTFAGTLPNAVAVSTAAGIFVSSSLSGNKLNFLVPAGTNTYAFALACPAVNAIGTLIAEYVYEANLSDGASYGVAPCLTVAAATGPATGTYDISAIPGAVQALIVGAQGYSGAVNGVIGAFSVSMPAGLNDVAVLALDAGDNVLAVKMLRAQTVPGPVNAGATIIVSAADEVTNEAVTITGVPIGFAPPVLSAAYLTANGTFFTLMNGSFSQYPALSFADISATDQYQISSSTARLAIDESIGTTLYTMTGTAVTLNFPQAWVYTPPAAAPLPTFSYVYSGFSGLAAQTYRGQIAWQSATGTVNQIGVYASAAFLGTQTTFAIPNLSALPGFFGSAASGTTVNWLSEIDGGSFQSYVYPPPAPGSLSYVRAKGTYVVP